MAINFLEQNNPTATNMDKNVHEKTIKLVGTDFTTGGLAAVKAIFPADSTFLDIVYWKKTAFSGNGVTAATISVGIPGSPTLFASAFDVNTPAAGTQSLITPITNIMQPLSLPNGADISLLITGTATTGNPTAGELYLTIYFVR